ncbi:uncharacterized protein LOC133031206 [Cannabis sativa]|uniref:uncharacterized protein LOC133031206 n=1 Tax=Cannabis sativa TaxID=3483 RepID=UPI0029CA556E|nr:uncharacterized protein LOC133031206 [Cannabis sativa]
MRTNKGLHKVSLLAKGIHIVRFMTIAQRDEVLQGGYLFFDKKPVIMKAWDPYTDFTWEDVRSVATWIQILGLDLKYWGEGTLLKIFGQLGTPIMLDEVTKNKERLSYPRIMLEVWVHQKFPDSVSFTNELNQDITLLVIYEWLPIVCEHCSGMGHKLKICKKKEVPKQVWMEKRSEIMEAKGKLDTKGFQRVKKGAKVVWKENKVNEGIDSLNNFEILQETGDCYMIVEEDRTQRGGILLEEMGLVGLLETKIQTHRLGAVFVNMFSRWCFSTNNAWYKGGRIMVSWNPSMFSVNIVKCTSQLMQLKVQSRAGLEVFVATFVYAFNDKESRKMLWDNLKEIEVSVKSPRMVLGDFNDILSVEERIGGNKRQRASKEFKECVEVCGLENVKFTSSFFTCSNKQDSETRIYSKIDLVLANQMWLDKFSVAEVLFILEGEFDHSPTLLSMYLTVQ